MTIRMSLEGAGHTIKAGLDIATVIPAVDAGHAFLVWTTRLLGVAQEAGIGQPFDNAPNVRGEFARRQLLHEEPCRDARTFLRSFRVRGHGEADGDSNSGRGQYRPASGICRSQNP